MLLPPCTNTTTGRGVADAAAGCQTFRYRQSSEPTVWASAVPMVASYLLLKPGPYRRPDCTQAFANSRALRGEVHGAGSAGAFQRSSPVGGLAKGMPFQL